jgi:hypothetical protein
LRNLKKKWKKTKEGRGVARLLAIRLGLSFPSHAPVVPANRSNEWDLSQGYVGQNFPGCGLRSPNKIIISQLDLLDRGPIIEVIVGRQRGHLPPPTCRPWLRPRPSLVLCLVSYLSLLSPPITTTREGSPAMTGCTTKEGGGSPVGSSPRGRSKDARGWPRQL